MHFLSPFLLPGLLLAGVPILIHLLNRRRFTLVDWAPMKYLKLTIRSNRRRMQIEQLLLLALRTLLMILIVLTVARIAFSKSNLGAWLARRARVSRVIVLDDSLPMAYRTNGKSNFDLAKQAATEILRTTGSQDAVTFLTTAPASPALIHEASLADATKLIPQIQTLQPTDAANNWAHTFNTVDDCLNTATFPQKQLILITDLRRTGWSKDVTHFANRWASKDVEARIIDIGSHPTANLALLKFSQDDPLILPNAPVKLTATIRNDTNAAINAAQATLSTDGQSRPVMLPDLPIGATVDVPLSATLNAPGQHQLRLTLPDDNLNPDNTRNLSLTVREKLDLTLVDGRQGSGPFESASDFLQVAFSVGQEPWHVLRLGDADPAAAHPTASDLTCLVNIANLSPATIRQYEDLVRAGMGLMIFAGEQVDPTFYNENFYKNGTGLLPMQITRIADGPVKGLLTQPLTDSPLNALSKIAPAALSKIETKRFLELDTNIKLPDTVRILARWNDPESHPAIVEKRFGKGRVLLFTTTADREWSDWPIDPTYVLAVRTAALAIAHPDSTDDNIIAGHPLIIPPTPDEPKTNPRLTVIDDPTPIPIPTLTYPHTQHAGIYTLTWNDPAGKQQQHQLAISPDRTASDLDPLPTDQLTQLLGNLHAELIPYTPGDLATTGPGHEIWRTLAGATLVFLVIETLLAFYVGREK